MCCRVDKICDIEMNLLAPLCDKVPYTDESLQCPKSQIEEFSINDCSFSVECCIQEKGVVSRLDERTDK